jgi:DNA-binding NarL/FixJ family response regulator
MARVALLCPDLLFGSRVEGGLAVAGHDVRRFDSVEEVRAAGAPWDLLVVDLTSDGEQRAELVAAMKRRRELDGVRALGFYSHVDQDTRRAADRAGFDMVVPRSRMAREMAEIADRVLAA